MQSLKEKNLLMKHRSAGLTAWLLLLALWFGCVGQVAAHPAWGIVVAPEGTVYFADTERDRIWMITPAGRLRLLASSLHSHALFHGADGYLYGENLAYDAPGQRWLGARWRAHSDDSFEELLPLTADVPPGWGIIRDAAGATYAVEQTATLARLLKRTSDGTVSVLAGGAPGYADGAGAQARFSLLEAITLGADGALYVRDNDTIRRVTLAGAVTTLGGNPLGGVAHAPTNGLLGLAADERGNVYVADMAARCVRRIHPDQRVETIWQSDWFWMPTGVALRGETVYVLENLAPSPALALATLGVGPYIRVYGLSPDGAAVKLATVWGPTTRTVAGVVVLFLALFSLWRLRKREKARGF